MKFDFHQIMVKKETSTEERQERGMMKQYFKKINLLGDVVTEI